MVAKQGHHFRQYLMRKDIIEKVTLKPSLEGDEGARPRHLGKNVPDTGLALEIQNPEVRVCLQRWRNCKESMVSGKAYVMGESWKIRL